MLFDVNKTWKSNRIYHRLYVNVLMNNKRINFLSKIQFENWICVIQIGFCGTVRNNVLLCFYLELKSASSL